MRQDLFAKYAAFAVEVGINLQPGQTLLIETDVEGAAFARQCASAAFAAGADDVVVHYTDRQLERLRYQQADAQVLEDIKPWRLSAYQEYIKNDDPESVALLRIQAPDPEIFKGLDPDKVGAAELALRQALRPFKSRVQGASQWCIVAIPTPAWAAKVFPHITDEGQAVEALWEAIFQVSRMNEADPVEAWRQHSAANMGRRARLDDMQLVKVHLTSANGTDLTVHFADGARWAGAQEVTPGRGTRYIPNVPTEEVFTTPHRDRVDGVVYGTKPYVYNGDIIDGFCLHFKDGAVVRHTAKVGDALLERLLQSDQNACRLGEFALVPATSPIHRSGLLFYNTLFDENAACHIAFGNAYSGPLSPEELAAKGINTSVIHADVMIGAEDMDIVGYSADGTAHQIFKNGDWAL